jgi:hypothetical protein
LCCEQFLNCDQLVAAGGDRPPMPMAPGFPLKPWRLPRFLMAGSCNFRCFFRLSNASSLCSLASAGARATVVTGRAARWVGAGRGLPAFPAQGAAGGSALKAGLRVYVRQAAGRSAVAPRSQPALTLRGGPVPWRGASPGHSAAALLVKGERRRSRLLLGLRLIRGPAVVPPSCPWLLPARPLQRGAWTRRTARSARRCARSCPGRRRRWWDRRWPGATSRPAAGW